MVKTKNSIYTDGSCIYSKNKEISVGAWVSIILIGEEKQILHGTALQTTHQRMELLAVLKAIEYLYLEKIENNEFTIYTDSQYVVQLQKRKDRLINQNFKSGKGAAIQNHDLIKKLLKYMEDAGLEFEKVKAHDKKGTLHNYNRQADLLCRKIARKAYNEIVNK